MKTGFRGTFVISWSRTEIDGQKAAPLQTLETGVVWSWAGDPVRVDGPSDLLRLDRDDEGTNIRKRAAQMVRRLVGAAIDPQQMSVDAVSNVDVDTPLMEGGFVVTDGSDSYTATVIDVAGSAPLLMFLDELPPKGRGLWVVHQSISVLQQAQAQAQAPDRGVICFTPGTRIATPEGPKLIEALREGDRVQTRDSGAQEIQWIGSRRMTGARLFAMPKLRPIRIKPGALGIERPDQELLVSPEHRMLLRGATAQALFNAPEVLVAARDLVNGSTVAVDAALREVTYVHLLLPGHEVIWANGVETESFHPASADLDNLAAEDRARLLQHLPELGRDPHSYGPMARRNLSASEAAILLHDAA